MNFIGVLVLLALAFVVYIIIRLGIRGVKRHYIDFSLGGVLPFPAYSGREAVPPSIALSFVGGLIAAVFLSMILDDLLGVDYIMPILVGLLLLATISFMLYFNMNK